MNYSLLVTSAHLLLTLDFLKKLKQDKFSEIDVSNYEFLGKKVSDITNCARSFA